MDKGGRVTFWDILIIVGIVLILGWALLKSLGVISSPVWINMIPYYGAGIAALGVAYKIGMIMNGINITNRRVNKLLRMEERLINLENSHNLCISGKLKGSPYKNR